MVQVFNFLKANKDKILGLRKLKGREKEAILIYR